MKLTRKPGTGDPYAGFDEAGAGNGLIPSTAPVLDPTDEGELEIELLATTPALYSTKMIRQKSLSNGDFRSLGRSLKNSDCGR